MINFHYKINCCHSHCIHVQLPFSYTTKRGAKLGGEAKTFGGGAWPPGPPAGNGPACGVAAGMIGLQAEPD